MSHYATLLAHSKRLGVKAIISDGMEKILKKHFPNISIKSPAAIGWGSKIFNFWAGVLVFV